MRPLPPSVGASGDTNNLCRAIALSKPVWLALIADLTARGLMDQIPKAKEEATSAGDLIREVKRLVCGPESTGTGPVRLLPGGRYITVAHETHLDCWSLWTGGFLWTRPGCLSYYAVEILDDGDSARFFFIHTDSQKSVSEQGNGTGRDRAPNRLVRKPFSISNTGDARVIASVGVVVNWRLRVYIVFHCHYTDHSRDAGTSSSPPPPGGGHIVPSSLHIVWHPLPQSGGLSRRSIRASVLGWTDQSQARFKPLVVDDLGAGRIWSPENDPPRVAMTGLYPNPVRRNEYKLLLYLSPVQLLAPVEPRQKSTLGDKLRKRLVPSAASAPPVLVKSKISGLLFTFHLSAPEFPNGRDLHITRTSAVPSTSAFPTREFPNRNTISYAGYVVRGHDNILDVRLLRPGPGSVAKDTGPRTVLHEQGRECELSTTSGAVTSLVDLAVLVKYYT
ncbi:hypothetical protein FB451DRAFT_1466687 [Mycena latifolia]|nr:hypothetical protein FB451DRAFT_1466687 [Mycena latifolia]